jgi:carbon monoxide dehydrogenase subunit G
MIFEGVRMVNASSDATWQVIAEPASFLGSLDVVSEITSTSAGAITVLCVLPLGFGDLCLDADVRLVIDPDVDGAARYLGTARGDGVHISFDNSVEVSAGSQPGTSMLRWSAAVILRGPIVGMVQHVAPILVARQVDAAYAALVSRLSSD